MCTSRPAGCFFSTLYFAQASDCRFLCRSRCSIPVAALISYLSSHLAGEKEVILNVLTSQVKNSTSGRSSKSARMTKANVATFKSCFRALKETFTSTFPSDGCHVNRRPECRPKQNCSQDLDVLTNSSGRLHGEAEWDIGQKVEVITITLMSTAGACESCFQYLGSRISSKKRTVVFAK